MIFLLYDKEVEGIPAIARSISHYFSDSFKFAFIKFEQLVDLRKVFPEYYPTEMIDEFPDILVPLGKEPADDAEEVE